MLLVDIEKRLSSFTLKVRFETEKDILALLGASGAGKSVTLKCIAGIETPDKGKIILNGRTLFDAEKKVNLPPQKRNVGYLFQEYALFPNMNVRQNIMTGLHKEKENERKALAEEIIKNFHLEGLETQRPATLSGGERQRVALARIFASKPEVLLLDEPFSSLDSFLGWELSLELKNTIADFDCDVVMVSHNINEVTRMCDTVSVISDGTAQTKQNVRELIKHPKTLAAAKIVGIKNFSKIDILSDDTVRAVDWDMVLKVNHIPEDATTVCIRNEDIRIADSDGENTATCRVSGITEDANARYAILDRNGTAVCMCIENGMDVEDIKRIAFPKEQLLCVK